MRTLAQKTDKNAVCTSSLFLSHPSATLTHPYPHTLFSAPGCGNYLNTASPTPSSAQSCASPCLGDPTELCGSPSFLTVYYFIGIKGGSSDTCRAEKSASVFDIFLRPKNTYTSGVVIKQYVDHVDEQGKIFYYLSVSSFTFSGPCNWPVLTSTPPSPPPLLVMRLRLQRQRPEFRYQRRLPLREWHRP